MTTRLLKADPGRKEVAVCTTGPASNASSGFAYGWTKSEGPPNDSGDVDREGPVVSVPLNVLEYVDGAGEVDRVGTSGVTEETGMRRGLTCDGGGADVSGGTGLDNVLARPREKTIPGRDGRDDEDVTWNA